MHSVRVLMWQTQSVWPVRTVHISVCWLWTLCHTIQHRAVLIIFPLNLQTITITRMLSSEGQGRVKRSNLVVGLLCLIYQRWRLTCITLYSCQHWRRLCHIIMIHVIGAARNVASNHQITTSYQWHLYQYVGPQPSGGQRICTCFHDQRLVSILWSNTMLQYVQRMQHLVKSMRDNEKHGFSDFCHFLLPLSGNVISNMCTYSCDVP